MEDAFKKAVNYIYSWVHSRFNEVFDDMPGSVDTYDNERPGYKVSLEYDNENLYFKEITTHLDSKVANRLWISIATIKKDGDRLLFDVSNEYMLSQQISTEIMKMYCSAVLTSMER